MSEQKDTIYIDIDDEITGIIDKVTSSKKKVVALVLPKRATVMQSVVNMRLLKRACDSAGKSIVLITSDNGVLPLAGVVGMYTAKTLQSKPFIPSVDDSSVDTEEVPEAEEPVIDETTPVGELAGIPEEEAIEVDNEDEVKDADNPDKKPKKEKKDKKLKIPNFDSFRKKLFLGIGILLLLGVGWYVMFYVLPKATITIKTDTTTAAVEVNFIADPSVTTMDAQNKIVPATVQEVKKTNTQKAATTGEKNLGEKAGGDMTFKTTTDCFSPVQTIPSGTTVSSGSQSFVTDKAAKFGGFPENDGNGNCVFTSNEVTVTAAQGGGSYNLSARNYTVAGFTSTVGNGSDMTGGTDKIVKIVSQQDVDGAKTKALEQDTNGTKNELAQSLQKEGYLPIEETFVASEPVITATPAVGAEANEVSVTVVVTYKMTGAKSDDVKKLIDEEAKKSIDTNKQLISDYGLDSAVYQVYEVTPSGQVRLNFRTNVTAGTQLSSDEVKNIAAGKRRGEVQEELSAIPGVKDVEVAYSPFWVTKTTNNKEKITVIIENEGQ